MYRVSLIHHFQKLTKKNSLLYVSIQFNQSNIKQRHTKRLAPNARDPNPRRNAPAPHTAHLSVPIPSPPKQGPKAANKAPRRSQQPYLASPRSLGWRKLLAFFDVSAYPTTSSLAGARTTSSLSTAAAGSPSPSVPTDPPDTMATTQGRRESNQHATAGTREEIAFRERLMAARSGMRGASPEP
jgi:hypothetical protein